MTDWTWRLQPAPTVCTWARDRCRPVWFESWRQRNSSWALPAIPWPKLGRRKQEALTTFCSGPIFSTPSKLQYGPPLGLPVLREVTAQLSIPIFALGGITVDRVALCRQNGAAGIAGIRIFQDSDSLDDLVRELRAAGQP